MPTDNPKDEIDTSIAGQSSTGAPESDTVIDLFPSRTHPLSDDDATLDARVAEDAPTASEPPDAAHAADPEPASAIEGAASGVVEAEERHTPPEVDGSAGGARLLVVGVGGAGCNIVNHMIESDMRGVTFLAVNTDTQALSRSRASQRMTIGESLTRGMGTGGDPAIGQQAAQESYHELVSALTGSDMVFITAGMGGGTGTGASPIVAQAAREVGALTLGIVTTPFQFERRRRALAEQGIAALRTVVDALIIVPNERLAQLVGRDTSIFEAYRLADEALRAGVQGLSDLITIPGIVNLDFADVRAVISNAGSAYLATGSASGEGRAENALRATLSNPLLDVDITGARGLLFNVTGGDDLSMREVEQIADALSAAAHPDANLIFGATYDAAANASLKVTVVATGFEPHVAPDARPPAWAQSRIPQAPTSRVGLPDVSVAGPPSLPPEPSAPGHELYNVPLPQLSEPPGGRYRWSAPPSRSEWPSLPPYQPPAPQRPTGSGAGAGSGVAPATRRAPQPPMPPSRSGSDQLVGPTYPREEYAENTDEQESGHQQDHEDRHGFWSRLFSSSPSNPPHSPDQ